MKIKTRDKAKTKKRINNEWSRIEEMRITKKSKKEVETTREERTKKENKLGESDSKEKIFLL